MAEIVLTIPNAQVGRVVTALCIVGGYDGDPEDNAARREFARGVIKEQVRELVLQVERQEAAAAMRAGVTVDPVTID